MKYVFYLNGSYVPASMDVLNAFTPGRQRLNGVFETMRLAEGEVEYIDEHLIRMVEGLKSLKIQHRLTISGLKRIVIQVVKKNPSIKLGRVRVMVFKVGGCVHHAVFCLPYVPLASEVYQQGLKLHFQVTNRPATRRTANTKSLDYALFADAYTKAQAVGYDEALLINQKGHIFEASRANVFIVYKDQFLTPPLSSGCLNGIMRTQVFGIARDVGVQVIQRNLTKAMIKGASQIFLTNSMIGIIPAKI